MLKKHFLLFPWVVLSVFFIESCATSPSILKAALSNPDPLIQEVLSQKDKHEIQILLTQIERKKRGETNFKEESFQLDKGRYFYPASTAKLPIAILSLQKIRALQTLGIAITAETPFRIQGFEGEIIRDKDSTHPKGSLSIHHLIKKIFLVSDNDAYNYLFYFLGTDYINTELKKKGLLDTQLYHKFLFGADNSKTWAYTFFDENQQIRYHQPSIAAKTSLEPHKLKGVLKGEGYMKSDILVAGPMDFSQKNRISIQDLQGILKRIIFPETFPKNQQFDLSASDYDFLKYWMSRTTLESKNPDYNREAYWDSYGKFLLFGDKKGAMSPKIRVYNKVGFAYGTLTDVAYIKDSIKGDEFFLTATLLVNENQIFNDDTYEFETKGIPFLGALGRAVLKEIQKE